MLPTPLTRLAFRAGHAVMTLVWAISEPDAIGAKIVVMRGDELLLVRLTYGRRRDWDLPGGTLSGGETIAQTAARELFEEVGLSGELTHVGRWGGPGRRGHGELHGFATEVPPGAQARPDPAEIAEARWFARDALPERLGSGSAAIIAAALGDEGGPGS